MHIIDYYGYMAWNDAHIRAIERMVSEAEATGTGKIALVPATLRAIAEADPYWILRDVEDPVRRLLDAGMRLNEALTLALLGSCAMPDRLAERLAALEWVDSEGEPIVDAVRADREPDRRECYPGSTRYVSTVYWDLRFAGVPVRRAKTRVPDWDTGLCRPPKRPAAQRELLHDKWESSGVLPSERGYAKEDFC